MKKVALKHQLWLIGAIIYVAGMFPLFYFYQVLPFDRFGTTMQTLTYISLFGAIIILFLHMLVGAWGEGPKAEDL